MGDLIELVARLALDLVFVTVAIQFVYYRLYRRRDHAFTCYLFNVVTLCLCTLLRKGASELGFALALFGIFGILRYRTEQIRSRDLTYLFIMLSLGIINGVADPSGSLAELLMVNAVIVGLTALIEIGSARSAECSTPLYYDRLDLLQPGREAALAADIQARTGLAVDRVETERIDLLRDAAELVVHGRHTTSRRNPPVTPV